MDKQNIEAIYPLAPLQEAFLWHSLQASSRAGLLHVRCMLCGELNLSLLRQAWEFVVSRHPALRTSIHWEKVKQPLQVVSRQVKLPWMPLDWRELEDPQLALADFLAEDRDRGFDLTQAPIMRLALIRLNETDYELVWSCHHLMLDGWSGALVLNQVFDSYEALRQGKPLEIVTAPTYQDYIRWLKQQDEAAAADFWQETLKGFKSSTPLPAAQLREVSSSETEKLSVTLSSETTARLQAFLRSQRLTLSTLMQGIWALVLYSYSGEADVLFGTTVSGRQGDLAGVEAIVGMLNNVLPLRVRVLPDKAVLSWLQTLQTQQATSSRYAYASPIQIQAWSQLPGRLFDSLLVIQNHPIRIAGSDHSLQVDNVQSGIISTYGLTAIVEPGDTLTLTLRGEAQRFNGNILKTLLEQFQAVLRAIVEKPMLSIGELLPSRELGIAFGLACPSDGGQSLHVVPPHDPALDLSSKTPVVAPRNSMEKTLADIWTKLLGLEEIGIHDNFFEAGGHSLLVTQMISQLRQSLNLELPLRSLFEYPTIAELAQQISQAEIAEPKADSLAFPTKIAPGGQNYAVIQAVQRDPENLCLSFAQQRLWFLNQLEGPSPTYNIPFVCQLEGNLNLTALEQSLRAIVQRHEVLRTTFPSQNGVAHQRISTCVEVECPLIDLQALPKAEKKSKLQALINAEVQKPFDLAQDNLIRFKLLRLGETTHVLTIAMHHIVSDGWSIGILQRELSTLYTAFCQGQPAPLAPLPIQYADFANWQRQWLQGQVLDTHLNYWRQQLANSPPLLDLPTDFPRPPVQTFRGKRESFELNHDLTQKLKTLSQNHGATLFMLLLASFQVLLYRYSGQSDLVVGSPIANRNRVEIEPLIGFFVNTLALRANLAGDPSFIAFLKQVRQTTLDAYKHQDLPFEQIVAELQLERNLSHAPLFQVVFALQNTPKEDFILPELTLHSLEVETNTAKFDLTLSIIETDSVLKGNWEYNSDLFEPQTIRRAIGHFQTLLAGIVANPQQPVSQLPLLTEAELHQLLVEWNQTQAEYPQDKVIHQLFEEQVEKTPDAIAVIFEDKKLTYQQLNEKANQLGHYLQKLGVKPETLVGICVERSLEMIIGLLGILKAGGAYVPLDPQYPPERLNFMLEDTNISILLTTKDLTNQSSKNQLKKINLINNKKPNLCKKDNLKLAVKSDNLAYVIYTSGSTGRPKGVLVPHHAVNRLVRNTNYIEINSSDNMAQIANNSFDATIFEIWGALLNGAKLILFPPEKILQIDLFVSQLQEKEISVIFITTALFNKVISFYPQAFSKLKYVLFGGEKAELKWVKEIYQKGCPQQLIHVYGPTENTTFSSWYGLKELSKNITNLPIGRPINNTKIYILDSNLQPVPIGVTGDIYLGGEGLARGYLNAGELTAQKFISNPFGEGKLYKTGDLARYLPDAQIEFLGRIDNQVKIRGFRIELGEIEANLNQYPQVKEAVLIAQETQLGDKRLIAYLVTHQHHNINNQELRQFLQRKLPDYMIPAAFVTLESLPLTANGKVDRQALPQPDSDAYLDPNTFVPPSTQLELKLAQIWESVLQIQPISIHANFFEIGGDSLLAVQLFAQIAQQLECNLPLTTLFQAPTIAQLSQLIEEGYHSPKLLSLVEIQAGNPEINPPLFLITTGASAVLKYAELAKLLGPEQPVYSLQALDLERNGISVDCIKDIAAFYLQEMATLDYEGPYLLGGYCFGGLVALEMAQQIQAEGQEVALLILVDTGGPNFIFRSFQQIVVTLEKFYKRKIIRSSRHLSSRWLFHRRNLLALSSGEKLSYVSNLLRRVFNRNSTPNISYPTRSKEKNILPQVNNDERKQMWKILKLLRQNYFPQFYSGRVVLFFSSELSNRFPLFPRRGWGKLFKGDVEVHLVPGNHYNLFNEPNVQVLAEKLTSCIDSTVAQD